MGQMQGAVRRRPLRGGDEAQRSRWHAAARPFGSHAGGPLLRCGSAGTRKVAFVAAP